jgi:hypothetical protein
MVPLEFFFDGELSMIGDDISGFAAATVQTIRDQHTQHRLKEIRHKLWLGGSEDDVKGAAEEQKGQDEVYDLRERKGHPEQEMRYNRLSEDPTRPCTPEIKKTSLEAPLSLERNVAYLRSLKRLSHKEPVILSFHKDTAMREAGCMLRFVALRLWLDADTAMFVGQRAFPESFGGVDEEEDHDLPLPTWLKVFAVFTGILLLAAVYAWSQIIRRAVDI